MVVGDLSPQTSIPGVTSQFTHAWTLEHIDTRKHQLPNWTSNFINTLINKIFQNMPICEDEMVFAMVIRKFYLC
jgi:hypothetical protein